MRLTIENFESLLPGLPVPVAEMIKHLFATFPAMGHQIELEPVPDELDVFALYGIEREALDTWAHSRPSDEHWVYCDPEGFLWECILELWRDPPMPEASASSILNLVGFARKCESCHTDERQAMTFEKRRGSHGRYTDKERRKKNLAEISLVECYCTNQCCGKHYVVKVPKDSHTREHYQFVLAEQWQYLQTGGVCFPCTTRDDSINRI